MRPKRSGAEKEEGHALTVSREKTVIQGEIPGKTGTLEAMVITKMSVEGIDLGMIPIQTVRRSGLPKITADLQKQKLIWK